MKTWRKTFSVCVMCLALLLTGSVVFGAELSDDNSLSDLGIENAVSVTPEFEYSTTEYEVVVPEGTEELLLYPITSNGNASYNVSGQKLRNGETTVSITVTAESGVQAVYTLYVQAERPNAAEQIAAANETEAPPETQQIPETQPETEAETQAAIETEGAADPIGMVLDKVELLKNDTDIAMKVIYGLIAFSVLLLFVVINLILKNRDLKDDLRDAQEKMELQTNEFARKERFLATDNYYAPVQQQAAMGVQPPSSQQLSPMHMAPQQAETAPAVEEAFGAVTKRPSAGGIVLQQPTEAFGQNEEPAGAQPLQSENQNVPVSVIQQDAKSPTGQHLPPEKNRQVSVTMVDL